MDALLERIKHTIYRKGVSQLRRDELSIIWYNNANLTDGQKRIFLQNFAMLHGLFVVIDYGLECAVFR